MNFQRYRLFASTSVVLLCFGYSACNVTDNGSLAAGGGSVTAGGTSSFGGVEATTGGTAVTTTDSVERWGFMDLEYDPTVGRVSFLASFFVGERSHCPTVDYGDCSLVKSCGDSSNFASVNAGTLTIRSSKSDIRMITDIDTEYYYEVGNYRVQAGETIHFASSGTPSVSVDITVPPDLHITTPSSTYGGEISAVSTHELVLNYVQGTPGTVLQIVFYQAGGPVTLNCPIASESGILTIQAAALTEMGMGNTVEPFIVTRSQDVVSQASDIEATVSMPPLAASSLNRVSILIK